MNEIGAVVCEVYAAGARLMVLDGGLAVDGEIPGELMERVRDHRVELLNGLVGDPLERAGWEARTALYHQALRWLDGELEKVGTKGTGREHAAVDALCQGDVAEQLNTAWCDGSFDEFRRALRNYARAGLLAAKRKDSGDKAKAPATAANAVGM